MVNILFPMFTNNRNYIDKDYPLILASASPRRRRLLAQVQLPFQVVVSHVDEAESGDAPAEMCQRLAQEKAVLVHSMRKGSWILGADTIVVIGDRVLGKPSDKDDAKEMLSRLSGVEHAVITGFCIVSPSGEAVHSQSVATAVRFKPFDNGVIDAYIQTKEPFGKAGAYAIQGIGAFMVESISGSYTNVVGLPVCAVVEALIQVGALRHFPLNAA